MSRGFVRGLWGIFDTRRHFDHRKKLDNDFIHLKQNEFEQPFTAFVWGEDNYKQLCDHGFNCELVDKKPIVWDMEKRQFRHKIEIWRLGLQIYDEIVHLDWDTQLTEPLPEDFWDRLHEKQPIQAILRMYHRSKAKRWRTVDKRKVPCGSWVYIGEKRIGDELVDKWTEMGQPWSEEEVLAKYTDDWVGGWKGVQTYWDHFEPPFFKLGGNCGIYDEELINTKTPCYRHFTAKDVNSDLKEWGIR